jgi:hypothetical protein
MKQKIESSQAVDNRPAYEPPRALRLDGTHTGEGGIVPTCEIPGSSAVGDCATGAGATGWCYAEGNSAEVGCDVSGNTAGTDCLGDGGAATVVCSTVGNGF